ncbi:nitroreductase family protein [Clostridium sp. WILCCON 0269]|uniref:Nitroreductase family protein n=1 Tax=Candidatus Clostridium eludens TaxID=3381663 RepID=A0ABW8SG57_9CLOT
MYNEFSVEESKILDKIIEMRRSVRLFKKELPSKEIVEAIVNAGLWGPYAGLVGPLDKDFRKFYVTLGEDEKLIKLNEIIKKYLKGFLENFEKEMQENLFIREKGKNYHKVLSGMVHGGLPGLIEAPCIIIVAEKRGIPPVEKQSLAHVMENMWLKAASLNLGFRLISVIEGLTESKEFCELLDVNYGEYAFNGCIIGYPENEHTQGKRPILEDVITWL